MTGGNFDEFAEDYRTIHTANVQKASGEDSDFFSEFKIKELASRKVIDSNSLWLDFGCGDGNSAKFVKQYFPSCTYIGVDVSQKSIETANLKNGDDGISFVSYDGNHLPFESETLDVIFIACVLHHIVPENRPDIMNECRRVLKKTGKIIIFEHNPYNPVTRKMVDNCPFDADAQLLSWPVCKKLLINASLKPARKRYIIFIPRKGFLKKLVPIERALTWLPLGGQYYVIAGK